MKVSRQALLAIPVFAVISLFDGGGHKLLRRLATDCINTVYTTPEEALGMPEIPPSQTGNVPAYITLCQEWIRMDAEPSNQTSQPHRVEEDARICRDWSAPHLALMDIFSAMIVASHIPGVTYRHNCDRTKINQEALLGFDATTIQQTLDTPGLRTNNDVLSTEAIKQQCRRCLLTFDPAIETSRVRSRGFHHCFAWPDNNHELTLDASAIPYVPYSFPGVVPFSSMIVPFRQRLYQSALAWQSVTDKPPEEQASGVVYWVDPSTVGLAYEDVYAQIPDLASISSFSILSGPLCATAILQGGQQCKEYGQGLADYLTARLGSLQSRGFNGEHGVTFKIVASTAAAFSRMILANLLICPPRSPGCLLPSVAKRDSINSALMLDEEECHMCALEFATIAGHHGTTTVTVLDKSKIPGGGFGSTRHLSTSEHQKVNGFSNCDGYFPFPPLPAVPSDEVINGLSADDILNDMKVPREQFDSNPTIFTGNLEVVPTMEEVNFALANQQKMESNQIIYRDYPAAGLGGDGWRLGELATDTDSGMSTVEITNEYWEAHRYERHESLLRMQHEWSMAFYTHVSSGVGSDDPSTVYEVQCPISGVQPDGSTVTYEDGTVTTTRSDMIIVSNATEITIKDVNSGITIATGIKLAPLGTTIREPGGDRYQIKDETDPKAPIAPPTEAPTPAPIAVSTPAPVAISTPAPTVKKFNFGFGGNGRRTGESPEGVEVLVVEINSQSLDQDLPFKAEVQKVCNKYSKRLQRAVAEFRKVESQ